MTYTVEQIRQLPKGSKLDLALVEAFGWIAWEETRRSYKYVVFQRPGGRDPYKLMQRWELEMDRYRIIPYTEIDIMQHAVYGVPDYSTTWSGMELVVEEMQRRGLQVYMMHDVDGTTFAQVFKGSIETLGDAQSNSAPHAVAIAALLALKGETEHELD